MNFKNMLSVCFVWPVLVAATAAMLSAEAPAQEERRIVVVGEVQGAYQALVKTLQVAELIDEEKSWVGGSASLVQTGDFLDDGTAVREVMDLLMRLQDEAESAGGQVVVLLGNHEAMNLLGELRDVNYSTYETFADESSASRQEGAFREYHSWLTEMAERVGGEPPPPADDEEFKAEWFAVHPPGWIEYNEALGPQGVYGKWLRTLPVAVRIGDLLFVHGGIDPSLGIDRIGPINDKVFAEISTFDRYRETMVDHRLALEYSSVHQMVESLEKEIKYLNALPAGKRDKKRLTTAAQLQDLQSYGSWYLLAPSGPLWFRLDTAGDEGGVSQILNAMDVRMLISGQKASDGRVTRAGGGNVVFASTGMSDEPWVKYRPSCLEIEGQELAILDAGGEHPLE